MLCLSAREKIQQLKPADICHLLKLNMFNQNKQSTMSLLDSCITLLRISITLGKGYRSLWVKWFQFLKSKIRDVKIRSIFIYFPILQPRCAWITTHHVSSRRWEKSPIWLKCLKLWKVYLQ